MRNAKHLLNVIGILGILLLLRPLSDAQSQKPPPDGEPQETVLADLPNEDTGVFAGYSLPGGKDGKGPDAAAGSLADPHRTRFARWKSSPMTGPVGTPPVANFGIVESGIVYRSAQPSDDQLRWLQSHGFKSIVSFRRESGDHTDHMVDVGFKNALWLNIEDETNPNDEQALRFLDFVTDPENWPVLIHCKVGLGRTGTMAALIRYAIDGWTMEQAMAEARLYRGGIDLVPSQIEWLRRWEANHPPSCHRPIPPVEVTAG